MLIVAPVAILLVTCCHLRLRWWWWLLLMVAKRPGGVFFISPPLLAYLPICFVSPSVAFYFICALCSTPCCQVYFDKCPEEPHLEFKGERYNLLQIHIHSPSEHVVSKVWGVRRFGTTGACCALDAWHPF